MAGGSQTSCTIRSCTPQHGVWGRLRSSAPGTRSACSDPPHRRVATAAPAGIDLALRPCPSSCKTKSRTAFLLRQPGFPCSGTRSFASLPCGRFAFIGLLLSRASGSCSHERVETRGSCPRWPAQASGWLDRASVSASAIQPVVCSPSIHLVFEALVEAYHIISTSIKCIFNLLSNKWVNLRLSALCKPSLYSSY